MSSSNVRDYTSIYGIKDFILNDIAPCYFEMDDVSLQNVGLFGMVTDIGATVAQDNFNVTSRYITELLPGKSVLPEFIYAEAANYGINNIFSTPASCSALIFIKEDDIIQNGEKNKTYIDYFIDADTKIFIDDVVFQLPYTIRIRSKLYGGVYNHNCIYYDADLVNSIVSFDYPYIKHIRTRINGGSNYYIGLKVELYQYNRRLVTESIVTNNTLNIPYIDVPFDNRLCNFEIIYKDAAKSTTSQLLKLRDNEPAINSPFCYYKMVDEQTLRISFNTNDIFFTPEYKSELDIYVYETLGDKGNFSVYNGNNIYVTGESSEDKYSYNNLVPLFCTMTTDSVNGDNGYSLDELKFLTWEAKLSLKSRTTDEDLERFFNSFTAIYDTKALFIKTRDDFASREYSCYTRIKDDVNIFPTNTLNLDVSMSDLGGFNPDFDSYRIQPGEIFAYNEGSSTNAHIVTDIENETQNDILYTSIAMINIELNPNTVSFYINSIDKVVDSEYDYINDESIYQFILKNFSIYRNSVKKDMHYRIKAIILPSDVDVLNSTVYEDDYAGDIDTETDTGDTEVNDDSLFINNLSLYLYVESGGGRYLKMNYVAEESSKDIGYTFECYVETNDVLMGETLELTNMISCESGDVETCGVNIDRPGFKLMAFYKEDVSNGHEYQYRIPDTLDYTLCNIFTPNENNYYLMYQLSAIKSTLSFVQDSNEDGFSLRLSNIPLFGKDFILDNASNLSIAVNQLIKQHDYIIKCMSDLIALFEVHIKLFNTYGKSTSFTIEGGEPLNRTHCSIAMGIKLFEGVDEACLSDIKLTIKRYIEGLNNAEEDSINYIIISQLITILHNEYENEIDAIVFYSINGYDSSVQLITMKKDLSTTENIKTIPEFLTINTDDIVLTTL